MKIIIYTDGSCLGNPGPGGWGVVIVNDGFDNYFEFSGKHDWTTNNRMELEAIKRALYFLKKNYNFEDLKKFDIEINTDSKYVKDGITKWLKNWKKNDWKKANKTPVKNYDLWVKIDEYCEQLNIIWKFVKGHSGNEFNDRADALATKASHEVKSKFLN